LVSLATHLAVTAILSLRASGSMLESVKPIVLSALASVVITSCVIGLCFWFTTHPISIFFMFPLLVSFSAFCGWFFVLTSSLREEVVGRFFHIITIERKLPRPQVGSAKK